MIRRTMLLPALMVLVVWVTEAQSRPPVTQIHRIHVAVMGSGTEADRFHKMLENELRNSGFEISEAVSGSEGDLGGEFSYETHGDFSSAHANLRLKSSDGKQTIWSGDYVAQHKGTTTEDVVKTLAQTCAERFRHQVANAPQKAH